MSEEKKTILLADDDLSVSRALKLMLENDRTRVDTAESKEEALALIEGKRYDLYLLDLRFTGVDSREGLELARAVRAVDPNVPIFLLTAWGDQDVARQADELAVRFLEKPVEPEELISLLREAGVQAGPDF